MEVIKDCIIHNSKCKVGSVVASSRISYFLSELFQSPLIDCTATMSKYDDVQFDTIYYVNSPSAFCKKEFLEWIADKIAHCRKVVWIQNEITVYPPTQVRNVLAERPELIFETWSNIPTIPKKRIGLRTWVKFPLNATHYINWNQLTYEPTPFNPDIEKVEGLMYYGAFRNDRVHMFERYFAVDAPYPIHISTAARSMDKFLDINPFVEEVPPLENLISDIQPYKMTVYIEDHLTNKYYNSPANRFYECLSAGVPQVFDETSINTFNTAGYDISNYVVTSPKDVAEKLNHWSEIRECQLKDWSRPYKEDLIKQVKEIYDSQN